MDTKYNRIVATGLIAMMLANFTACDGTEIIVKLPDGTQQDITISQPQDDPNYYIQQEANANAEAVKDLKGSVWEACKGRASISYDNFYARDTYDFRNDAIPLTFLQEVGLLYYDEYGVPRVNGNQPGNAYYPFKCISYIDKNTNANDVYLLLQYQSDSTYKDVDDKYLATWMLKYELDDDDYQTFLKLNGNHRIPYFIQEMDKQYEPEVITKTVVDYNIPRRGGYSDDKEYFPYLFIADIDYSNKVLTFGATSKEGIRYYDLVPEESNVWKRLLTKGYTEEELNELINMKTKSTILGECLITFDVDQYSAGILPEQAKEKYNNTDRIQELVEIDINPSKYNIELNK